MPESLQLSIERQAETLASLCSITLRLDTTWTAQLRTAHGEELSLLAEVGSDLIGHLRELNGRIRLAYDFCQHRTEVAVSTAAELGRYLAPDVRDAIENFAHVLQFRVMGALNIFIAQVEDEIRALERKVQELLRGVRPEGDLDQSTRCAIYATAIGILLCLGWTQESGGPAVGFFAEGCLENL